MHVNQQIKKRAKRLGQKDATIAMQLDLYLRACRLSRGADSNRSAYWGKKAELLENQLRQSMEFLAANQPLESPEFDSPIPSQFRLEQ